jgi:hypothetical protein
MAQSKSFDETIKQEKKISKTSDEKLTPLKQLHVKCLMVYFLIELSNAGFYEVFPLWMWQNEKHVGPGLTV